MIVFLQKCNDTSVQSNTIVIRDTIMYHHDTTYVSTPTLIERIKDTINNNYYTASLNFDTLQLQFDKLKGELLSKNIYRDTARYDSSQVIITDVIQQNEVRLRKYEWDLKYPVITVNNYIPAKISKQIYVGGQVSGGKNYPGSLTGNVLLKTKEDKIFGVGVGMNTNGNLIYSAQAYIKLKLKK